MSPVSFSSKSDPFLAFSVGLKIQDAEDGYQNLPKQETGEGLYFSKNSDYIEKQQNASTLCQDEKTKA